MTLPDGWVWTTIGNIADINRRDPKLRDLPNDVDVTFVPMAAVDAEMGTIAEPQIRSLGGVRKGFTPFCNGDVLFAKITPSMENGKAAIAKDLKNGLGFGSTEFHTLSAKEGLLPAYLYYFIRQESFRNDASAHFAGTAGQLRVPSSFIVNYPFPLPPLSEQERIVRRIESLFTQLEAGEAGLKRAQAALKRYRASVLKAACEGRLVAQDPEDEPAEELLKRMGKEPLRRNDLLELPEGWVWSRVGDISCKIQYGTSEKANLDNTGVPVLRMGNIQNGELELENLKYLSENTPGVRELILDPGDILFNRTNSAELVGKTAVYREYHPRATFASYIIRFRLNKSIFPDFVSYYINSILGRQYIATVVSQQVGQANVNGTKLANMPIPIPPIEEQRRIVAEVERRLSVVAELEAAVSASLKRAGRLRQTILKQAFEGRLVAQEAGDESAERLLERIEAVNGQRYQGKQLDLL